MRVRAAVVGVGALGQHHARLLAAMPEVELVGVVDIRPERAQEVATRYGCSAYADLRDVVALVDAVTIAVPTESHREAAEPFLERGIATLVEKPMAASVAEADAMMRLAAHRGAMLAVGHTERFNPAVMAALPLVRDPRFVEVHRLGVFPGRSLDIDVVFDLMIHDLDLLLQAVASEVVALDAVGVHVLTPRTDIANARVKFASGCTANVTASRISRDRVRKARFFQHDSYVSIDYAAQEVEVYRLVGGGAGRPIIEGGPLGVAREEPLLGELRDFIDAVRHRREPLVTGQDGRAALELASRIATQMAAATT